MKEEIVLKKLMDMVIKDTFEAKSAYLGYKIVIVPKELKSKHGHYIANDRKIELFNLAREPGCTMMTCLHEITHHIEFMDLGTSAHKKSFYDRFHALLLTALSLGLITPEDIIKDGQDSNDLKKLIEYYRPIDYWDYELTEQAKKRHVLVTNGYASKDLLKQRGYRYSSKSQAWGKEFPNELYAYREQTLLKESIVDIEAYVVRHSTVLFSLNYYVAIPGAFEFRKILKENGYRWNAYGIKSHWVKKVPTNLFYSEEAFLKDIRLLFKKVTPKSNS